MQHVAHRGSDPKPIVKLPDGYTHESALALLKRVDEGFTSVRAAAVRLSWMPEQVQICIWGEVRL